MKADTIRLLLHVALLEYIGYDTQIARYICESDGSDCTYPTVAARWEMGDVTGEIDVSLFPQSEDRYPSIQISGTDSSRNC